MNWSASFARRTHNMKPSAIREILKLTQKSSVISFAGGLPAPNLFPVERLREAAEAVLGARSYALHKRWTGGVALVLCWIHRRSRGNFQGNAARPNHPTGGRLNPCLPYYPPSSA